MAKRTPRKPPVRPNSSSVRALRRRVVAGEVLTLADIAEIRRRNSGEVRGGVVRTEYGASGTLNVRGKIYSEDYNRLFDGANGIKIYDQMERSDAQVGSAVDIIRLPIRSANWRAVPPQGANDKEKAIAEALHESLFEPGKMVDGWDFVLRHLLMRVYLGFGLVEKVWMFDEDKGILRWDALAPRLPKTVKAFNVFPNGRLRDIQQYVPIGDTGRFEDRTIPALYACLSVREREGDNYFGRSVLRRVYKHWWYKDEAYRIDGVRLDRYGVGIPVAKIMEGHILEDDELREIELTLQSLRSHDRAYIVEPPLVNFRIMMPEGSHGGATGLMESVKHHDQQIVRAVLATFLGDHAEGLNTNRTRTLADIFLHALKAESNAIRGDVDTQLSRPFCDLNFDMTNLRYPVIEVTGLGDLTAEDYAKNAPLLVTAGLITPDDTIEDMLRKSLGFAPLTDGFKRGEKKPEQPQLPAKTGEEDPQRAADRQETKAVIMAHTEQGKALLSSITSLANVVEQSNVKPIIVNLPSVNGHKSTSRRLERDPMTGQVIRIVEEGPTT